jgi:DHA2 family multidrug resistance protein-like MFS transporter
MRPQLPAFLTDLARDRAALRTLITACLAIGAAGLDPHVLDPGMPSVRAALRTEPELQSLFTLGVVIQGAFLIVGGVAGDLDRRGRVLRLGLGGLIGASLLALLWPSGPGLVVSRMIGWASTGLILPFAIGSVAVAYGGAVRATALGIAYACLGAATATAPALALAFGPLGPRGLAFGACILAAVVALVVSRGRLPDLPGARNVEGPFLALTGLWAFGIIALTGSILGVGRIDSLRAGIALAGVIAIVAAIVLRRRATGGRDAPRIDVRAVAVVLVVGMVVGFAQAAPLLQLPLYFRIILDYEPLLATIAIAPFVVALLVAGPLSGWLLARVAPRILVAVGLVAVGVADILFALVVGRAAGYPLFILPFALVGGGFVIATTIRTAIIFASVPRGLPASAAAFNEASVGVGSRIGTTVATVLVTSFTLGAYEAQLAGLPPEAVEALLVPLRDLLAVIGLPDFGPLIEGLDDALRPDYFEAVVTGLRASHLVPGVIAVAAGLLAIVALGRRDPVRSVWEYADERGREGVAPVGERPPSP